MIVDPVTGEVMADREALAAEWVALDEEIHGVRAELRELEERAASVRRALVDDLGLDGSVRGDGWTLVVTPGSSGRRMVAKDVAQAYQEVLLDRGLGERVEEYRPPTLAQVNAARAELVAAGVPLGELVVGGQPGPPQIEIVKGA